MKRTNLAKLGPRGLDPSVQSPVELQTPKKRSEFLHLDRFAGSQNARGVHLRARNEGPRRLRTKLDTSRIDRRDALRQVSKARGEAIAAMRKLAELGPPTPGTDRPKALDRYAKGLVRRYAKAMSSFEQGKEKLLAPGLDSHTAKAMQRRFGAANSSAQFDSLSDAQYQSLEVLICRFSRAEGLGLKASVLEGGASPASERVLMALSGAIASIAASVPSDNVDHLASVYRGVLEDAQKACGQPLSQAQADRLAFDTVCTDVWMKGQSLDNLSEVKTAPTNAGDRGDQIYAHIKERVKERFDQKAEVSAPVRAVVHSWIDNGFVPMAPGDVDAAAEKAGLSAADAEALKGAWGQHIMATGDFWNVQSFMLGIWLHGIPDFASVEQTVQADGRENAVAQEVYYAVLGHHMAGFIATGFARGDLSINFEQIEAAGQIPEGAAQKLESLYAESVQLAAKWRPKIDQAAKNQTGLSEAERAEYRQDAAGLRAAIAALPFEVRTQLLNDDSMQFTELGIEKWLNINKMPTNGETLHKAYLSTVQAYFEEDLARSLAETPGEDFIARAAPVAERLGIALDNNVYRLISTTDPADAGALSAHAKNILEDANLAKAYTGAGGDISDAVAVVNWFRAQPADTRAMTRLAQA